MAETDPMRAATERAPAPPLPFWLAAIGAILGGAAYCLAFAGYDIWPLAFVAFVPTFVALRGQSPKRALWIGTLMGATMNLGGFYWLNGMLKTFSGFPTALCLVFTTILCTYQGGRMGLMGWLYARATQRGWPAVPVFLAAFAASELVYPLLFPWYFAATVHLLPAITQIAELGGPILIGVVVVAANVALAEPLMARLEARAIDRRVIGGAVAAMGATLLFGLWRIVVIDQRAAESEPLHVGIVQGNMGLMQKREDPAEGLRRHIRMTRELKDKGAELVVWSESSATFPMLERVYKERMRDYVGSKLGVPAIVGAVIYRHDPDRERWFNTALSLDQPGDVHSRYDKQYLLAFGEYLPFSETFPQLHEISPNSGKFTPGTRLDPLVLDIKGKEHVATTLICYEDILPRFTNAAVNFANPDLLVNITNDAWFGDTTEPWEHLALAKFRAIEHRRYLVRSTNSGVSAIVDPVGRVVVKSGTYRAEHVDAVIRLMRATTVYEIAGDVPWMLVTFAVGLMAFRSRRKAAPRASTVQVPTA